MYVERDISTKMIDDMTSKQFGNTFMSYMTTRIGGIK